MIYSSCSIDSVIGQVIRNTRVQDSAFLVDMHEWIPEGMELMHTKHQYYGVPAKVPIKFHKGKLPCGTVYVDAVEYCGERLPYGNSVRHVSQGQRAIQADSDLSLFTSTPVKSAPLPDGNSIYLSELEMVNRLALSQRNYYQIELGCILTSFETGEVTVYTQQVPVDSRGMPLIPDNANYKEALYWYVRKKMIEAGFNDTVFKWDHCHQMFEMHAARAVTEIDYPSPDQMENRINLRQSLVTPQNYYQEFFRVTDRENFNTALL